MLIHVVYLYIVAEILVTECLLWMCSLPSRPVIMCCVVVHYIIRHNKHAHTKTDMLFILLVVYSTCRMVGHHCIIVHTRVTRTYATYYLIRKELMWTLSTRWEHDWPQIFIRTEIINLKMCVHVHSITSNHLYCVTLLCVHLSHGCGCVGGCVIVPATSCIIMICIHVLYYWVQQHVMPWWEESQRNMVVVMFICVCVCVLFCSVLFSTTATN